MGFRTNFYHYPIDYIESIKDTSINEEDGYFYFDFDDFNGDSAKQRIIYDAFTNSVLECENNENICSPVFTNCPDDCDNLYLKMNKEQFGNFIKYVLKKFIDYKISKQLRHDDMDKLKDELKDGYNIENQHSSDYEHMKTIDKLISNQWDENLNTDWYRGDLTDIDDILNNKWIVSQSWETKLGICNLIHVYHMMDWDNEEIIIVGG